MPFMRGHSRQSCLFRPPSKGGLFISNQRRSTCSTPSSSGPSPPCCSSYRSTSKPCSNRNDVPKRCSIHQERKQNVQDDRQTHFPMPQRHSPEEGEAVSRPPPASSTLWPRTPSKVGSAVARQHHQIGVEMATPEAIAAIRAAKNLHRWGAWATTRFLEKRNVPWRLYLAALKFEARRSSCQF